MKLTIGDVRLLCILACLGFWTAVGLILWCTCQFFGG